MRKKGMCDGYYYKNIYLRTKIVYNKEVYFVCKI